MKPYIRKARRAGLLFGFLLIPLLAVTMVFTIRARQWTNLTLNIFSLVNASYAIRRLLRMREPYALD